MSIKGGEDQVKVRTVELIAMPDRDRGGAEGATELDVCVYTKELRAL